MGDCIGTWKHALDALRIDQSRDEEYRDAFEDFQEHMDERLLENNTLSMNVDIFIKRGCYDQASKLMDTDEWRSLELGDKVRHNMRMAGGLVAKSNLERNSEFFSSAVKHLEFVEEVLRSQSGVRGCILAEALALRGVIHHASGDFESSKKFLRRACKLYKEQGDETEVERLQKLIKRSR